MEVQQQNIGEGLLNYAKAFIGFADPHRDCRFFYDLKAGHIIAHAPGMNYRIQVDGQTFFRTDSGFEVPAPGCPFPRELATLNAVLAFRKALRWLPLTSLVVTAWVVGQWFLWSIPDSPAAEFRANFIALFSYWMNVALVCALVLAIVSACLWNFGRGVRVRITDTDKDTDRQLLSAGTDISPDILIVSVSATETGADFADRMQAAEVTRRRGQWIVVIAFRSPAGLIITGGEDCYRFHRDSPDYQGDNWPEEMRIVPRGFRFASETWEQYERYLRTFAQHYPEWAQAEKLNTNNPVSAFADARRAETITFELNEQ